MHLRRPTSIAIDAPRQRMYFSDARNYTVQRRKIYGEAVEEVLDNGITTHNEPSLMVAKSNTCLF